MNISQTVARLRLEISAGFYFYSCVLSFFSHFVVSYSHYHIAPSAVHTLHNITKCHLQCLNWPMLLILNRSLCHPLFMMKMIFQLMILDWLISDVISKLKLKQSQVNSKKKKLLQVSMFYIAQRM